MPAALSASTRLAMAAGCAFLVAACSGEAAVATQKPAAAIAVEVLNILASGAGGDIRASGLVAYKRETALGFGAPGEIESILADVGDRVAAGQVLATMRRTTTGADASEAALARLTAEQNFERVTRLHAAGAASQAELDNAKLALERARERVSIVAPAGGIVLQRDAEPGQNVAAGQRVLSIGESRTGIIVEASMTASEVSQLRVGDVASVNIRERAALAGRVARIAPKGTQSGLFTVEVQVDQPAGLRSGEVAEVVIAGRADAQEIATVHVVPAISLIDARADQGVVFVVDAEGKARRRAIETGGVSDRGVTILKGLSDGDRVITRGASMVRDGDAVSVAAQ
ncbi:efflux RND transporter periplasmic adaptor subunit [Sphingobium sp.]|uniref:efflux RND transporter periplasmic adaptor subunit n=1 Tax=Sphingobium sp. TaxID=1912891 RepID=UPI00257AD2A9|nr:efflux RND transporter periplasmic adaptor subunit [Sphingobium sp.]